MSWISPRPTARHLRWVVADTAPARRSASAIGNDMESRLWSIVLAPDAGRPLSPTPEGGPEQFWRPPRTESMVKQAVARLAGICPVDRTVVVLNESQREQARGLDGAFTGRLVFQPDDRGTAAALLFGLLHVLTTDPAAMVLVTPANQAVENTDAFQQRIDDAISHARRRFGVVLCGAAGEFRNALAIVAPARALLQLCRQRLPVMSAVFVAALTMPPETQRTFLAARYSRLPSRDFAKHVLMASSNPAAYPWPVTQHRHQSESVTTAEQASFHTEIVISSCKAYGESRAELERRASMAASRTLARSVNVWK